MIWWRGAGWLVPVIFFTVFLPFGLLLNGFFIGTLHVDPSIPTGVVSSIAMWLVGRHFNRRIEDLRNTPAIQQSGEKIHKHSFFSVPMEYWSVVFLLFGIAGLVAQIRR